METGTIVRIHSRGFGFIRMPGGGDIFFHHSALTDGLVFDDQLIEMRVRFEVKQTDRGPQAVNVRSYTPSPETIAKLRREIEQRQAAGR